MAITKKRAGQRARRVINWLSFVLHSYTAHIKRVDTLVQSPRNNKSEERSTRLEPRQMLQCVQQNWKCKGHDRPQGNGGSVNIIKSNRTRACKIFHSVERCGFRLENTREKPKQSRPIFLPQSIHSWQSEGRLNNQVLHQSEQAFAFQKCLSARAPCYAVWEPSTSDCFCPSTMAHR